MLLQGWEVLPLDPLQYTFQVDPPVKSILPCQIAPWPMKLTPRSSSLCVYKFLRRLLWKGTLLYERKLIQAQKRLQLLFKTHGRLRHWVWKRSHYRYQRSTLEVQRPAPQWTFHRKIFSWTKPHVEIERLIYGSAVAFWYFDRGSPTREKETCLETGDGVDT